MKQRNLTAENLKAAGITPTLADDIDENRDIRTRDFSPLVQLGKALQVSPFELVLNSI